jgi:hypothetical protein
MAEIMICAIALLPLIALPLIGMKLYRNHAHYDEKIMRSLGIRHLTFERKSDILIAIGLVGSYLVAILVLAPQ